MAVVGIGVGVGSPATCSLRVAGSRAHPARSVTLRARDEMVTANLCSTRLLSEENFCLGPRDGEETFRSKDPGDVSSRRVLPVAVAEAAGCRPAGLARRHCSAMFGYLA